MKKSLANLALLTHTVNLLVHLRSPESAYLPSALGDVYKRLSLPHFYGYEDELPAFTVDGEKKEEDEELSDLSTATHFRVVDYNFGGTCGAYLVENDTGEKGIFKPSSGEGTNEDGSPLKRGVTLGEATAKEIAAYKLGADLSVPHTSHFTLDDNNELVQGSLQAYAVHVCAAEDLGPSVFSVDEVQKIGILDIRLLNLDRHLTNLLVAEDCNGVKTLIPIDHGYSFPSYHDLSDVYFGWSYFKQCKEAFTDKSLQLIEAIQPLEDAALLHQTGISSNSIVASTLATLLLQYAAKANLTLSQLADFMQSDLQLDTPSGFEVVVKKAIHAACGSNIVFDFSADVPHPQWSTLVDTFLSLAGEALM